MRKPARSKSAVADFCALTSCGLPATVNLFRRPKDEKIIHSVGFRKIEFFL